MPDDADANILQIISSEARQRFFVDRVVAERSLVLLEAKTGQRVQ